jgi:hypothetical protein
MKVDTDDENYDVDSELDLSFNKASLMELEDK